MIRHHSASSSPDIADAEGADYLRMRPDVAVSASSLADPASSSNLPQDTLQGGIDVFNRYARGETSDSMGRKGDEHPLMGRRWALLGPAKAYFTTTEGSPRVDEQQQVLDASGQPIPGL